MSTYIRCLDLAALRLMLSADDENEGALRYLLDGQRTPILYNADDTQSIALLASIPEPIRDAMNAYPDMFAEYAHQQLFDHQAQDIDVDGDPIWNIDQEGQRTAVMIAKVRELDVFDLFYSTTPIQHPESTQDGVTIAAYTEYPPTHPLAIAS